MKIIEQKIRSLYHSTVFLWLISAFFHIFSFFCVCLCRHFVCFSPVSRPGTQILSLFTLTAILNKFPFSVDKSVMWFLLCARVFSPVTTILENEKTLGTRLVKIHVFQLLPTMSKYCGENHAKCLFMCYFSCQAQKITISRGFTWFLILGKIQDCGQDGDLCWWRYKFPAAPPPIKYTSSC